VNGPPSLRASFVLSATMPEGPRSVSVRWLGLVVLVASVVVLALLLNDVRNSGFGSGWFRHDLGTFREIPFDRKAWLRDRTDSDLPKRRGAMYRDLVTNHLRRGSSRQSVFRLLGAPDDHFLTVAPRTYGYELGRYKNCVAAKLVVRFDADERLASAGLLDSESQCN